MQVRVILQILSTTASACSNDAWLYQDTEATDLADEDLVFDRPVLQVTLENNIVCAYVEDRTFYGKASPDNYRSFGFDWSQTEEFKAHVAKYLAAGWKRKEL